MTLVASSSIRENDAVDVGKDMVEIRGLEKFDEMT